MPRAPRASHQVIVIGAGIAGLAAAAEAARCSLKTALFDDGLLVVYGEGEIESQVGEAQVIDLSQEGDPQSFATEIEVAIAGRRGSWQCQREACV